MVYEVQRRSVYGIIRLKLEIMGTRALINFVEREDGVSFRFS